MTFEVNRLVLFALGQGSCCAAFGQQPADLVILHGKIYTDNPGQPQAEPLAIRGGKIDAVGFEKEIEAYRGPSTQIIDAQQQKDAGRCGAGQVGGSVRMRSSHDVGQ